jgi:plasmid stabilization system protein ParE
MAKIRWSLEAFERFKSIKEFIEEDSPQASQKFAEGIVKQIEYIALFPKIGKSAFSESYPNLRLLIWKNYKI